LFDSESGEWYCDVFLDPEPAYAPLVRFGIARYQPHALKDCELSPAIALDEIVLPSRRDVTLRRTNGILTATVTGAIFDDRAPALTGGATDDERPRLQSALKPQMRFQLQRVTPHGPIELGVESVAAPTDGDVWRATFDISPWSNDETFAVLIEEFTLEGLALSEYRADVIDRLVERKLLFAYQGTI
jgi:hypothetical protein